MERGGTEMEATSSLLQAVAALLFVLALLLALAALSRRLLPRLAPGAGDGIEILSTRALDTRNRISLLRHGRRRYLVLFGPGGACLLDRFDGEAGEEGEDEA